MSARDRSGDWFIEESDKGAFDVHQGSRSRKPVVSNVGSLLGGIFAAAKGLQDGQKVFHVAPDGYRTDVTRRAQRRKDTITP